MSAAIGTEVAPGVTLVEERCWYDKYVGTFEALVAAGLCRGDQLPGHPGGGAGRTTFYDGVRVVRGANPKHDEKYLAVGRAGKLGWVMRGVAVHVSDARQAIREQDREAERKVDRQQREADYLQGYKAAMKDLRQSPIAHHQPVRERPALPAGWRLIVNQNLRLDGQRS